MDWATLIGNLLFVIVGAIAGFFGSIGLEWWKQRTEKEELKNRIREELEKTLKDIKQDYDDNDVHFRKFDSKVFIFLEQDIIRKLDVTTYRSLNETYDKIHMLNKLVTVGHAEQNCKIYKQAIESITKTIDLLKKRSI